MDEDIRLATESFREKMKRFAEFRYGMRASEADYKAGKTAKSHISAVKKTLAAIKTRDREEAAKAFLEKTAKAWEKRQEKIAHLRIAIDAAIDSGNKELFMKLSGKLNALLKNSK